MLVSVIIPSFNQGDFLRILLEQIFHFKKAGFEIEVIVIDNISSDSTVEVLKEYHNIIDRLVCERDKGQSDALNKGLLLAGGEFVTWQNSDDLFEENAFELLVQKNRDCSFDVLFGDQKLIDNTGDVLRVNRFVDFDLMSELYYGWGITNQGTFIRRKALVGFQFDVNRYFTMDAQMFWWLASSGARFEHSGSVMGALRIYGDTKSSTIPYQRMVEEWCSLRAEYGVTMSRNLPWRLQYPLAKLYYFLRKKWKVVRRK